MQGMTTVRAGFLLLLGVGLSGCATNGGWRFPAAEPTVYPPDTFAHRVSSSHVVLYWNCSRPTPSTLRLDGVAHNPFSPQEVRFLELEVVGVDDRDRIVSQGRGAVRDFLLRLNQISPFEIALAPTGTEQRFDLYYQYRFNEGDGRFLSGPPVGGRTLLAQERRFMARDVCSDTQHRVR